VAPDASRDRAADDLEDRLIQRAQAGDFGAFADLARRHQGTALRVATVVLGRVDGAEDVVQDATVRAWRSIARFERGRPLRPWLLRIVANVARNERRSEGRRSQLALRAGALSARSAASPEEAVVTDAERARVTDALNRLGPDDRLTVGLRYFEQLSEREMAEVLDCPAGTVKSRLARAMGRLRTELERVAAGPLDEEEVQPHG
jgi:RNA polymerase sigma-70 factor (ECF subfamily)